MQEGTQNHLEIRSGGQTGADRAALDWAIQNGVPHGGWCPRGRTAEAEPGRPGSWTIPARYHLQETPEAESWQRTDWNVRDSDGTVILTIRPELVTGSQRTLQTARQLRKPVLHLSRAAHSRDAAVLLKAFLEEHRVRILNVAGSKASEEPGIAEFVTRVLSQTFPQKA